MRIIIAQGGGPTAVINQSLVGAIEIAKKNNIEILGARFGIRGILNENFVELNTLDSQKLEHIANTPGSVLGSTRDKPDQETCQKILKILEKHQINGFLYIGGNDSSETLRLILQATSSAFGGTPQSGGYKLQAFHIPKTIDNDLEENDHTPGFPSAARYVAKAIMGIERDNAALPGIHLCIIMGRHSGFLTMAAAFGGAHLLYVPEYPVDLDQFASEIKEIYEKEGRALIVISEGIVDKNGQPIINKFIKNQEKDSHGNIQLSSQPLGHALANFLKRKGVAKKVRDDTLGYPQRSYPDPSLIDRQEARLVGQKAVEYFLDGKTKSGSITINRVSNDPYKIEIGLVPLEKVANFTRKLPSIYYDHNKKTITSAGLEYLKPLVGDLPIIEKI